MELNIILFVSVLVLNKEGLQRRAIKYFIIQGLGSIVLVYGVVLASSGIRVERIIIIRMAVLLKLGLAPVHMWFINVIKDLD
jgi:NADH:ubiquinone oxidoreductase subunit 2 (subunit N)